MGVNTASIVKALVLFLQSYPQIVEDAGEWKLQYDGIISAKIDFVSKGAQEVGTFINARPKRIHTIVLEIPEYSKTDSLNLEMSGLLEDMEAWINEKFKAKEGPQAEGTNFFGGTVENASRNEETQNYEIQLTFTYEKE